MKTSEPTTDPVVQPPVVEPVKKEPVVEPVKKDPVVEPVKPVTDNEQVNAILQAFEAQKAKSDALEAKLAVMQKQATMEAIKASGAVDSDVVLALIAGKEDPVKAIEELKANKKFLFRSQSPLNALFPVQNVTTQNQPTIKDGESLADFVKRLSQ